MDSVNNTNINKNNKIELALASLMFFAPLIKFNLKNRTDIQNEDQNFINGFIKLWLINIVLLILWVAFETLFYFTTTTVFDIFWTSILVWLAILILIECIFVICEKNIIHTSWIETNSDSWNDVIKICLNYLPLYNIYIWYKKHDFEWENMSLKESIILRWLFSVLLVITQNKYILISFWVLTLINMISNIFHINFGIKFDNFISNIFKKNPEEIRWSIIWLLISPFSWKSISETITDQKLKYSLIYKLDHKQILLELIILILLWCGWIYIWLKTWNYVLITGTFLILSRYWIMLIKWKHMTHIPIIKELTSIFFISKNK